MNSAIKRTRNSSYDSFEYTLLTGCTGLLGRYLLRDLLLDGKLTCVLTRSSRKFSAVDRVEAVMRGWEVKLGRSLPRPIILDGCLESSDLGLNNSDAEWLVKNCRRILHSAASLKFETDENGEPERTNIQGTRNLLEFCSGAKIREFHFLSTAYVAGLRTGTALETELDVGQEWGNVYERSKCQAESMVRSCDHVESVTVYRPSIIVGDSKTGYTSTFHGFYTPLRLGYAIGAKTPIDAIGEVDFLGSLGLNGKEKKNLVPVDWVSTAVTEIMKQPDRHGQTYHLTNPNPVPVAEMHGAFLQELLPVFGRDAKSAIPQSLILESRQSFQSQMRVYEAYWRNDPTFDRSNTDRVLPHLPMPHLGTDELRMMARFAIDSNFGWPYEPIGKTPDSVRKWFQKAVARLPAINESIDINMKVGLRITGPGGLDMTFAFHNMQEYRGEIGIVGVPDVIFYMNSETFHRLISKHFQPIDALSQGRVLAICQTKSIELLSKILRRVLAVSHDDVAVMT